ncbi:MAG: hypothetical protein ACNA8P_01125 [Phycisphaerales bacterium]
MLTRLSVAALVLAAGSQALAGEVNHVVPNAFESTAAPGVFLGPQTIGPRTYQLLIHESQLTHLVGLELTGLTWRLPASASPDWPVGSITYSNYDIYLSQSVDPADRSLTFADNVVGTQTQVRSGPLTLDAGAFPSGGDPNDFGIVIDFSNYQYSGGNLLVELRHTGNGVGSRSLEAVPASGVGPGLGYGTLFSAAWTGSYDGLSGNQGNFAVTQFTAIPTPGAVGLLAMAGLAATRRRR